LVEGKVRGLEPELSENVFHRNTAAAALRKPALPVVKAAAEPW
jgi:hypothetical protein